MSTRTGAPDRPVRRRRRSRAPLIFLITLLVLAGALVVADRVAASVAAGQVADRLAGRRPFTGRPGVQIHGFPFVTQALGGRYSDIEVTGNGLSISSVNDVGVDAHLRGVHVSVSQIRRGVSEVPVDRIDVDVRLPWQDVARVSDIPDATITGSSSGATITAPLSIPVLGQVDVSATAQVSGQDDVVSVRVVSVRVGGQELTGSAADYATGKLSFRLPLSELPYETHLNSLSTASDGLHISGTVHDVVLHDLSADE